MKVDLYLNDNYIFYKKLFDNLLLSYHITIKKEHHFIYDDFLNHLISDSDNLAKKNYQPEKKWR